MDREYIEFKVRINKGESTASVWIPNYAYDQREIENIEFEYLVPDLAKCVIGAKCDCGSFSLGEPCDYNNSEYQETIWYLLLDWFKDLREEDYRAITEFYEEGDEHMDLNFTQGSMGRSVSTDLEACQCVDRLYDYMEEVEKTDMWLVPLYEGLCDMNRVTPYPYKYYRDSETLDRHYWKEDPWYDRCDWITNLYDSLGLKTWIGFIDSALEADRIESGYYD